MVRHVLVLSMSLVVACGSGGPDPGGPGSSSGGASSGGTSSGGTSSGGASSGGASSGGTSSGDQSGCGTCSNMATITVEESNEGGRLEGALVEACRNDACERGQLTRLPNGDLELRLQSVADAGGGELSGVNASVTDGAAKDVLRFRLRWSPGHAGSPPPVDGETYRVEARVSEKGAELFSHTFTAAYETVEQCGTCKVYEAP